MGGTGTTTADVPYVTSTFGERFDTRYTNATLSAQKRLSTPTTTTTTTTTYNIDLSLIERWDRNINIKLLFTVVAPGVPSGLLIVFLCYFVNSRVDSYVSHCCSIRISY